MLSLCNFGFYCNPKDSNDNMITLIPKAFKQVKAFTALFPDDASICYSYTNSYILKPITITAKFKQMSAQQATTEPKLQLSLDIDDFQIAFL